VGAILNAVNDAKRTGAPTVISEARCLDQLDNPTLGFSITVDVSLSGSEITVTREHLDVPKRASNCRYLPGRVRDEGSSPGVARASHEAEFGVPSKEHIDDGLRARPERSFGARDVLRSRILFGAPKSECLPKLRFHRDDTSGAAFARSIL
jgi:hypothetical protein